MTSRLFEQHII